MMLEPREIGEGITQYDGNDTRVLAALHTEHIRFLNELWLPERLSALSPTQIAVINRFREERMSSDPQYEHARLAREATAALIRERGFQSVLEIGCGKYPVVGEAPVQKYVGLDIDSQAVEFCQARGWNVDFLEKLVDRSQEHDFDLCVAIYVFHYHVEEALLDLIESTVCESGILVFNIILDLTADVLTFLTRLSRRGFLVEVVKTHGMSSKEFFFVLGRPRAAATSLEVASFITKWFESTSHR